MGMTILLGSVGSVLHVSGQTVLLGKKGMHLLPLLHRWFGYFVLVRILWVGVGDQTTFHVAGDKEQKDTINMYQQTGRGTIFH